MIPHVLRYAHLSKRETKIMGNLFTKAVATCGAGKAYFQMLYKNAGKHVTGEKKAQGILEYALLFVVVALGLVFGLGKLKNTLNEKLDKASNDIKNTQ